MKVLQFTITDQEIVSCQSDYQPILKLLQDKGAPVRGVIFKEIEPGWVVSRSDSFTDRGCATIFVFAQKDEK